MPRRKNDGMVGSVYVDKRTNKIIVKIFNQKIYTGLENTPANTVIANKIRKKLFLEHYGIGIDPPEPEPEAQIGVFEAENKFVAEHCEKLARNTYSTYSCALRKIITHDDVLSSETLENYVVSFLRCDVSKVTKTTYLRHFQTFVNYCVENYNIRPIRIMKKYKPKGDEQEVKIFTREEVGKILEACTSREFYLLIEFMLQSGARIGEALALTRTQIKSDRIIFPNKTLKKPEWIPLSESLKEILSRLPLRPKVFSWSVNSYSRLNRRFTALLEKAKVPKDGRSFHELRKTFLYNLFEAGVPVQAAQKLMRHRTIGVTIKYYTYFDTEILTGYMNKKTML